VPLTSLLPRLLPDRALASRLSLSLAVLTTLGALGMPQGRALGVLAEAASRPYRVVDLEHPAAVSQMVPLGATEFGAIVALGWRDGESTAAEVWVSLPAPMFGLSTGWTSLGPLPSPGVDRVSGVAFSPSLRVSAHAGATAAVFGPEAELETLVVGSESATAPTRIFVERLPEWDWVATAVSEDGAAVGIVTEVETATNGPTRSCWVYGEESGVFHSPTAGPASVVALAVTNGLHAAGVAFDGVDPLQPQYAVLMQANDTMRLDDLADGRFVFASSIDPSLSILAARIRQDSGMQLCRLVRDSVDPTLDGKTDAEDIAPFFESLVAASPKADVNLDGEVNGVDLQMFWEALSTEQDPDVDWGARALQLSKCADLFVDPRFWPVSVRIAAESGLRALIGVGTLEPMALHTPECVAAVTALLPVCADDWSDACEELAADFYNSANADHPTVSHYCDEIVCAIDSTCCENWDALCATMAENNCNTPGIGCAWTGQPWPYDWTYGGYCGAAGGDSYPNQCFNECCFHHDACYGSCGRHGGPIGGIGGGVVRNGKGSCDFRWHHCMRQKCRTGSPQWNPPGSECPSNLADCYRVAEVYFDAVFFSPSGAAAWCACCGSTDAPQWDRSEMCFPTPLAWPPPAPSAPAPPPVPGPRFAPRYH
jgi:hypothetical protein